MRTSVKQEKVQPADLHIGETVETRAGVIHGLMRHRDNIAGVRAPDCSARHIIASHGDSTPCSETVSQTVA